MARCAVSIADVLPQVFVESITLTGYDQKNTQVRINLSLQERISGADAVRWYDSLLNDSRRGGFFSYFRVRLVTCLHNDGGSDANNSLQPWEDPLPDNRQNPNRLHSLAASLDFWSQRFNEYHSLANVGIEITPEQYTHLIRSEAPGSLSRRGDRLQGEVVPPRRWSRELGILGGISSLLPSPFNNAYRQIVEAGHEAPNQYCYFYNPAGFLKNVVLYDRPLETMVNMIAIDVGGERMYLPDRNTSRTLEGVDPNSPENTYTYSAVDLSPCSFVIGPDFPLDPDLNHLSTYAFVYFDYAGYIRGLGLDADDTRQDQPALNQGMGLIGTATCIGQKTLFAPLLGESHPVQEGEVVFREDGMLPEDDEGAVQMADISIVNVGMI